MTLKEKVEKYLRDDPRFRERKNKDKGIFNLLVKKYRFLETMPRDSFIAVLQEYASMDRAWRQALEHDPSLRGSDYGEKAKLVQQKQIELGYTPGHARDVKTLKEL